MTSARKTVEKIKLTNRFIKHLREQFVLDLEQQVDDHPPYTNLTYRSGLQYGLLTAIRICELDENHIVYTAWNEAVESYNIQKKVQGITWIPKVHSDWAKSYIGSQINLLRAEDNDVHIPLGRMIAHAKTSVRKYAGDVAKETLVILSLVDEKVIAGDYSISGINAAKAIQQQLLETFQLDKQRLIEESNKKHF